MPRGEGKWHGGHADGIAGRGSVWVLRVGSCDGMSRAKHRLGRGVTGSDRRDPPTVLLIRKKAENALKLV